MMKNEKSSDRQGWRAEWIKEGGPQMNTSITYILNEIEDKPFQNNGIGITSIPKDKGKYFFRKHNLQNL